MDVKNEIFSDHMPLVVKVEFCVPLDAQDFVGQLLPKLRWMDNCAHRYATNLDEILHRTAARDVLSVEYLIDCTVNAANFMQTRHSNTFTRKQPWFNHECESARKYVMKLLEQVVKNATLRTKKLYHEANAQYKFLCKETRTRYYRNLETALNIANNSKSLWDLVRKINGTSQSKVIKVDVQALAAHFERILCRNMPIMQHHFAWPYTTILEMDREIEVVEVTDAIARCKVRKTPGEDRVPAEFFKNASPLFISQLTTTFNKIFATANVPDSFRKNVIYPIFKKGNALEPENYRGISFINAVAKVFTSVILARLTKWVKMHDILGEHQAGFREGYSTVDSIFALTAIANHHLAQKKKMYAFFVDFKAAFDTIDRNSLYLKLSNLGVSTKMINIVKSLYCQNKTTVWDGKQLSKWFTTNLGVKQGCLLSPLLFSLYVDDIMSILPGGVKMGTERIKVLMYADDMVLLADSPSGMQSMIDALYEYCRTWSLEINTQKSKILVIRESRGRRARADIWTLNGEELEIVTNYFKDGIDAQAISLIFRARTEVLRLSYVPHSSLDSRCTLCSTGEAEDTAHFIARCPMLSELRVLHFGQTRLNTTEINNFLNGSDWGSLIAYLRDATRYRQFIMDS
ncbi:hypothetical protein ACLKA7_008835 [Drosophila subpalustris]